MGSDVALDAALTQRLYPFRRLSDGADKLVMRGLPAPTSRQSWCRTSAEPWSGRC
jgi:hypothetical protein